MNVLYVDDQEELLEITKGFLEQNGYHVDIANSAAKAMHMLELVRYDALISDFQMPEMDGICLLKKLRSSSNNIPFILFTGRGREEVVIEALNSGADYYLQKGGEPTSQFTELMHYIDMAVGRRQAEAQLAESGEKFRSLVECIGDWRWETDIDWTITYSSPQVSESLGYRSDEVIGASLKDLNIIKNGPGSITSMIEAVSAAGKVQGVHCIKRHRDGHMVHMESSLVPILGGNGSVQGYRGVDRDVTKSLDAERALHEAKHRQDILEEVTWHDVMNQLFLVKGSVEMLRTEIDMKKKERSLARIANAADSIGKHIEFAKDYQRMGLAQPEWQSVEDIFIKAARMLDTQDLKVVCNTKDIMIKGDPMLIKAFFNLVDNSIRYGGHVTRVEMSAERDGEGLLLCYKDDGIGIPEAEKTRIFDKGFGKNTGLGMFLIRSILAITGITICEKGDPGRGVRFEMSVPQGLFRDPMEEQAVVLSMTITCPTVQ